MKPKMHFLRRLLPHLILILSLMLLTFLVLDNINPAMAFLDNKIARLLIFADVILSIVLCIWLIVEKETEPREKSGSAKEKNIHEF